MRGKRQEQIKRQETRGKSQQTTGKDRNQEPRTKADLEQGAEANCHAKSEQEPSAKSQAMGGGGGRQLKG
jgi:hypothetical protein